MKKMLKYLNAAGGSMNETGVLRCVNSVCVAEKHSLCATFEYRNALYAVVDGSKSTCCYRLRWNFFKGLYRSENVGGIAGEAARKLAGTARKPGLAAPHYKVTSDTDGVLTCKAAPHDALTDRKHELIPRVVRAALLFLIILIIFWQLSETFTDLISSLTNISSGIAVNLIFFGTMLAIAFILYALDDAKASVLNMVGTVAVAANGGILLTFPMMKPAALIAVAAAALLLFCLRIFPCLYFLRDAEYKKKRAAIRKKLFNRLKSSIIILIVFNTVLFIALNKAGKVDFPAVKPYDGSELEIKVDADVLSAYDEALYLIREDKWNDLTPGQRLDTLQCIGAYECEATLGCPKPKIISEKLESKGKYKTFGLYDPSDNTVKIDSEHLAEGDAPSVLVTLLHELRHGYQYALINMYNNVEENLTEEDKQLSVFRYVQSLRFNLNNYITSDKSFDDYVSQEAERDSNSWAMQMIEDTYYDYIFIHDSFPDTEGK